MNMLKNLKKAKMESLLESFKEVDSLIKELTAYKDNLKIEVVNRQAGEPLDYATNDKLHTVTLRYAKGGKTLDTKKAKELISNWENDCFTVRADSVILRVNDLKK